LLLVCGFFLGIAGTIFAVGIPFANSWYEPTRRGFATGVFAWEWWAPRCPRSSRRGGDHGRTGGLASTPSGLVTVQDQRLSRARAFVPTAFGTMDGRPL
jgi:hypothetical protein